MIPGNVISAIPDVSNFIYLNNEHYNPLISKTMGGTDIGNGTDGREIKVWEARWNDGVVSVGVKNFINPQFTLPVADILSISLAFDANMGIVLGWRTATTGVLYYFDSLTHGYTTLSISNITSCGVFIDDPRQETSSTSDVIFAYTLNNKLFYRVQRERYTVEHFVGNTTKRLIKVGLNELKRLQFALY
jgi:hypothetical protein